jgi:dephospho-CoA kinase
MINQSFIIGITGNIATGKSVIRRMLENTGAFTMDADFIAHRMLYPGGPAYQPVIDAFGSQILMDDDHLISNKKLGEIVFDDPQRLKQLESLTHPPVINTILARINAAKRPVVAVEAIKLLEAGLGTHCDSIWVSHASFDYQVARLLKTRGLTEDEAKTRINAQTSQSLKLTQADVIINTETSFKDTWRRTRQALNDTILSTRDASLSINSSGEYSLKPVSQIPDSHLEAVWGRLSGEDPASLYEQLGMRKVSLIAQKDRISAIIVCESWNFTTALTKVFPIQTLNTQPGLILSAFEQQARVNQSEVLLIPNSIGDGFIDQMEASGFMNQSLDQFTYPAWQMSAQKVISNQAASIWAKILAQPFEVEHNGFIQ